MRVLFLSQVLPYPLDAGPKIRSYYVLRHLTRQTAEVLETSAVFYPGFLRRYRLLAYFNLMAQFYHNSPHERKRTSKGSKEGRFLAAGGYLLNNPG